jgi:hypothetical protein
VRRKKKGSEKIKYPGRRIIDGLAHTQTRTLGLIYHHPPSTIDSSSLPND